MDTICEDEEYEEYGLEGGERGVRCNYDGRGGSRGEDGVHQVCEEGRHDDAFKGCSDIIVEVRPKHEVPVTYSVFGSLVQEQVPS